MAQRRRVKHTATFEERLAEEAINFKEAETASHINNWLRYPGLQPPKALEE
jgi:hypothetical protein